MKYPCLVLKSVCKTPITVRIFSEGISEDGEPVAAFEADLMCNYQDKAHTIVTADKTIVTLSGQAYFIGDIAPELAVIPGGEVAVNGETRRIYHGEKARNPDGSVNFTRLDIV